MRTIRGFSNSAPLMLYAKEILHVIFDNDLHPSSAIFPRFFFLFCEHELVGLGYGGVAQSLRV